MIHPAIHITIPALAAAMLACGSPQRETVKTLPGASEPQAATPPGAAGASPTGESTAADSTADRDRASDPWWNSVTLPCPEGTTLHKRTDGPYEAWCEKPDGTKHGPMVVWTPERVKYGEATYRDGQLDGTFTLWHDASQKHIEITYENGKEHGPYRVWHPNGQLAEQRTNVNGAAHGRWDVWHANGQLAASGEVEHGKRQGAWTFWDAEGKKTMVLTYRADEIVSAKRFKDGKPLPASQMASSAQCDAVVTKIEQFAGPGALDDEARIKIKQDCVKFMTGEEARCLANAQTMADMPKCLPDISEPVDSSQSP